MRNFANFFMTKPVPLRKLEVRAISTAVSGKVQIGRRRPHVGTLEEPNNDKELLEPIAAIPLFVPRFLAPETSWVACHDDYTFDKRGE